MVKIGAAHPEQDMMPLAQKVAQRIRTNRHSYEGAGSYVMADGTGSVFVLCEAATTTDATVNANTGLVVGRYSFPLPTSRDLFDDLLAHFVEIGFVTEQLIRDVIREVEG